MKPHALSFSVLGFRVQLRWERHAGLQIAKYCPEAAKPVPALERSLLRQIKAALGKRATGGPDRWPWSPGTARGSAPGSLRGLTVRVGPGFQVPPVGSNN